MAIFKCKMCGATLDIEKDKNIVECGYCGTKQTVPVIKTKEIEELYERANYFFHNNEYDKAADIYENISTENPYDPESYFMLALCKYGIEYVDDSASKKKVPTLHRLHYDSIFNDINYKKAIKHADNTQKILYEKEAKYIDEVRNKILDISKKEKPYDVFICYKETDEKGQRTEDSVLAMDIYNELTKEGLKVFFARKTLEQKLGIDYEPYIFAALNSAKVMVVVGTKPEYINSPWVRNEWTRFLDRINKNKTSKKNGDQSYIVPAYKGMTPYALPNEFSSIQAQDMAKVGATQDLVDGVKKLVNRKEAIETVKTKSNKKLIIGAIIGIFVIVLMGVLIGINSIKIYNQNKTVLIRGDSYLIDEEYESITLENISDFGNEDIEQLNKIKNIKELYFKNCILENIDFLSKLTSVKGVKFSAKTNILDFNINNVCEKIESFNYDYTSSSLAWNDLNFLTKMPNLVSVCVPICDDLMILSKLSNLENITLRSQKNSIIDNFQWCMGLEKVKTLNIDTVISRTKYIGEDYLSGIENLKSIEKLNLNGSIGIENDGEGYLKQKDIDYISKLITLKSININLWGHKQEPKKILLMGLNNLIMLEYIHFSCFNVFDLNGFKLENLKELNISYGGCDICHNDLICLSNCKNLENIMIHLDDDIISFDSNGNYIKKDVFYYNVQNKRKFSLKGIEQLNKLKVLKIKAHRHSGSIYGVPYENKIFIEILNEELAKNNSHLEYIIESSN